MLENIMPNIYHYDAKYILLQQKTYNSKKNQILKIITPIVYYYNTKYAKSTM